MSEPNSPGKEGLIEEAATWFARMRGPEAEASRPEFERWLARGALHRRAYNRAAEVFAMGKVLADDHQEGAASETRARARDRGLVFAGIAAVSLVAVAAALAFVRVTAESSRSSELDNRRAESARQVTELTAAGLPQSIRLADNSLVRLASGATLAVQFGDKERRLTLNRGDARFFVAHEHRPFVVYAGGGYVVAHGTVFDVGLTTDRHVTVRLVQGIIDVSVPAQASGGRKEPQSRRLHAGEAMSYAAAPAALPPTSSVDRLPVQSAVPADEKGIEDYQSISLADLVRAANVGSAKPLRIKDETTGELRISGEFRIDNTDLLADRVATLFNLVVDRSNPSEIVLSRH